MYSEYGLSATVNIGCLVEVNYQFTAFSDPSKNIVRIISVNGIDNPYTVLTKETIGVIKTDLKKQHAEYRQELQISVINQLK
jgi:hypothetical protein